MSYYQHHLFFCTHLRAHGKTCCGSKQAEAYREYAKQKLKKRDCHKVGCMRVNKAGCFNRCNEGPVLVIYPQGIWYRYETYSDIDEIIEQHLLKGQLVPRLLLPDHPPCVPDEK